MTPGERRAPAGPALSRRRLGAELRRLREQNALKLADVATQLGVIPSTLSRIETGKTPTRAGYLTIMLDLYGADALQRKELSGLARDGQRESWWAGWRDLLTADARTYLGLETEATALRVFGALIVPGLLQTEPYAAAVIAARRPGLLPDHVQRLVALQRRRQEVLRRDDLFRLHVILDESALLRDLGSRALMRAQLQHLVSVSGLQTATIQVLPLGCPRRRVLSSTFAILSLGEPADADVAAGEGIGRDVLVEQRTAVVQELRKVFRELTNSALPAPESIALISRLAE